MPARFCLVCQTNVCAWLVLVESIGKLLTVPCEMMKFGRHDKGRRRVTTQSSIMKDNGGKYALIIKDKRTTTLAYNAMYSTKLYQFRYDLNISSRNILYMQVVCFDRIPNASLTETLPSLFSKPTSRIFLVIPSPLPPQPLPFGNASATPSSPHPKYPQH